MTHDHWPPKSIAIPPNDAGKFLSHTKAVSRSDVIDTDRLSKLVSFPGRAEDLSEKDKSRFYLVAAPASKATAVVLAGEIRNCDAYKGILSISPVQKVREFLESNGKGCLLMGLSESIETCYLIEGSVLYVIDCVASINENHPIAVISKDFSWAVIWDGDIEYTLLITSPESDLQFADVLLEPQALAKKFQAAYKAITNENRLLEGIVERFVLPCVHWPRV